MRNFKLLLVFVAVFATLQVSALSRDCNLTVKVVAATGESLGGTAGDACAGQTTV